MSIPDLPAVVRIDRLSKSFVEGRLVLDDVHLAIGEGHVHALLGANGSGKSTLVKILAGYHTADRGSTICIDGTSLPLPVDPETIRAAGVRFVHQNQQLVAGLSVVDNMRLGGPYTCGFGWKIRWRREAQAIRQGFERLGIDVDPLADVNGLSLATVTKLLIVRALQRKSGEPLRLVVLDEPTATLGQEDAAHVLSWVRQLAKEESAAILFVSHRLSEVLSVADEVTVLRNGRVVAAGPMDDFEPETIVDAIVGRRMELYYPARRTTPAEPVLSVGGLTGAAVADVRFTVCKGEILGLTGLAGSGFEDVPYLLGDRTRSVRGECLLDGKPLLLGAASVEQRVRRGIALVPADRAAMAVAQDVTVRENVVLPRLSRFFRRGLLRKGREEADTREVMRSVQVVPPEPEMPLGQFSGGNQQKAVLGKWLATAPKVLVLHEPTQGVDVGARSEIFKALAAFADEGGAVVVASVEYEDLAHICNRVLVFGHGRVHQELAGDDLSTEAITAAAYMADALARPAAS